MAGGTGKPMVATHSAIVRALQFWYTIPHATASNRSDEPAQCRVR